MVASRDDLTLAIAVLGAVLGVLNFFYQTGKDKVRLKVTPKVAYPVGAFADPDDRPRICIEVVNRSAFPVTISDVGLTLWFSRQRLALIQPIIIDGKPWPRRLEPRDSVTTYFSPSMISDVRLHAIRRAYAKTDCGECRYGNSKALKAYKKRAH